MAKKQYMDDATFQEMKGAFQEAAEFVEGKRADLRTTTLAMPEPPSPMTARAIVTLRKSVKCSQTMFARFLNVSASTVRGWEQGTRSPGDAGLRLLEIAKNNPEVMFLKQKAALVAMEDRFDVAEMRRRLTKSSGTLSLGELVAILGRETPQPRKVANKKK